MRTKMHIYRVGRPPETVEIDLPENPGYQRLKELIEPLLDWGLIEQVAVLFDGRIADMFVDEQFRVKGLPRNDEATAIYRAHWLSQYPEADPESLPIIAGTAVVFDRKVWF